MKDPIFSIGSCFSDNIGSKLRENKFDVVTNPLGIIYNPYSIFKNLKLLLSEGLDPNNFIKRGNIYFHWDTHSAISGTEINQFKELLEEKSRLSKQSLIAAEWLVITLGTIYTYRYRGNDMIVANCHKVPQKEFEKQTLTHEEIVEDYQETMELVRSINPRIKVILTVSPVRHIRDGLIANNISKATLLQAVHDIVRSDKDSYYFPSYEIMIDELRDYRFYKSDMIHPSEQAINYIWNKLSKVFFDQETQRFIDNWSKILKSLSHKPFHPNTPEHQKFLNSTIKKLEELEDKVDVTEEISFVKNQLIE
ncbi:GSCFA domain-containing protein [Marinoscillum sp.]|uniref:GSCFA domain-containing protein n=1 Tax=Marinoscillum sp. TaxID=2024838 RepID=UPI003BADA6DB